MNAVFTLREDAAMETVQATPKLLTSPKVEFRELTTLGEWAGTFLRARSAEGVSTNTIIYYRRSLKDFLTWAESQYIQTVEEITAEHLRTFLIRLRETGHNPGGIAGHYRALRAFWNWYEVEVEPQGWRNPCKKVKPPKVGDLSLPVASIADVEKLYRAASGRMAARDRAIILTLADSGLRAAELLSLDVVDVVDEYAGELRVRCGKGQKSRTVFIGKRAGRCLRTFLKQRNSRASALFISDDETRLTYSELRQIVRRLSVTAGIPHTPIHAFRRFFAINFLRGGGDLLSLQRILGHSGLSLLGVYARQNVDDLRAAHAGASPMDRGL
jgi:site-specific recombinase XerD